MSDMNGQSVPATDGSECAFPSCECPGEQPVCEDYFRCPNYGVACDIARPHYHFKVRDGERIQYLAAPSVASARRAHSTASVSQGEAK